MGFLRFIGFTIVRAWQGFWRNAMMSLAATATVVLMLVLLAALFIVISGLNAGWPSSRARWRSRHASPTERRSRSASS